MTGFESSPGLWVTARWVGTQAWWARGLFAVTGGWVPTETVPAARIHLAGLSRVFGDHVGWWTGHLPVVAGTDPDELVAAPTRAAQAALDRLADAEGAEQLAAVHRVVVPHLLVTWAAWAETANAVADAPVLRTLRHARADLREAWEDGEGLLAAAAVGEPTIVAARAPFVADLEQVLHARS